ncbi:MAG: carbamoyltransferase [Candidatus Omnitrophica bacterium]|nr:carbamoyltransferase [Candidatus Omnitrophota bacterium]
MNILGISCFYHDSAACLVQDGKIVAAVEEERLSRKKHDSRFPLQAVEWCLNEGKITVKDVDIVVFYDKPWIKFERILKTSLTYAPSGIRQFIQAVPLWLKQKLWIPEIIRKELNYKGRILFVEHHESHAASAFYPSPFKEAAVLTMDGVGEWDTASFGVGSGNKLDIVSDLRFPHSLGLLYSAFTYYCGFKVNSGEYKLMGLAPYGEPKYVDLILNELMDLKEDGSFKLNLNYFSYCNGLKMTNAKFDKLFDGPCRKSESRITQREMDIAASIQRVTEEVVLRMGSHVHKVTGKDKLCLAGGVALNCVANGRLLREGPFKKIWIQPASGDAGGALGAALFVWYKYLGNSRSVDGVNDLQGASLLGPYYSDDEISKFLEKEEIVFNKFTGDELANVVADLLIQGNVIGWFQGRLEFGPRALGSRSIIGDPRNLEMQSKMNLKIKYRESFRPFAPSVLQEKASEWFDLNEESPYMLLVSPIRESKRKNILEENSAKGFDKLKVKRSEIPAVTHVDYSARVQTVKRKDNPLYYDLINAFYKKTGCPVIINTSFNVRGEPLVASPEDAFRCFMRTEMDYLVLGNFLLNKKDQKKIEKDSSWQQQFELD